MLGNTRSLEPLEMGSAPLRRKITEVLRQAIEDGTLRPGTRLVEKDLCADLKVSRTPLREALRELEADGLVTYRSNGRLVVARITRQEAENIYEVRASLEALVAAQFVSRASQEEVQQLRVCVEKLTAAYDSGDLKQILNAKVVFYDYMCLGAKNQIIRDMLKKLNSPITQLRALSLSKVNRLADSITEIEAILLAVENRDSGAAQQAAFTHVRRAQAAALTNLPDE